MNARVGGVCKKCGEGEEGSASLPESSSTSPNAMQILDFEKFEIFENSKLFLFLVRT